MNNEQHDEVLPSVLKEVFRTQKVWDESGNQSPLDSNVSESEARLLFDAVIEVKPLQSVEVGLAKGVSTLAILGALAENGQGRHVVMDPFQDNYKNSGIEMVRRSGLEPLWEFHRKFAEEVIPSLGAIQFAFIDASHLFDLTLVEFVMVDKKLDVGGVVGFHDMWMPSLQGVFRFILSNRSYEVWQPGRGYEGKSSRTNSWKDSIRAMAKRIPKAEKIFAKSFLHPWKDENLGNLVFLRKTGHDTRHWTYHQSF
ncbi:class I SAM-dependent methyltransferase [Roseimicrobium sp. ORNL1]|uniref:class I SAM-dependent methyltransferase n=1 Tax=Roseimicrobium sp. ORNL1 TaxID=2711231 RepID=UPI0013E1C829|nr:class I SAM-dependent methyltransferase [Roseimicrobium sp. ORNL1]QIF02947.1 class I SAM-dependent methyltransferase [Roseimicrobium sp. ORNL1]